jgi:hypothetical protein
VGRDSRVAYLPDGSGYTFSVGKLTELVRQQENKKPKTLTDSHPEEAKALTAWVPEFFDYENRHGITNTATSPW